MKALNDPINAPINSEGALRIHITMAKKPYSQPKLFKGKKDGKTSVAPGTRWYVTFYTRDEKGLMKIKHSFYRGINTLKTIRERTAAGIALRDGLASALQRGWLPGENAHITNVRVAKKRTPLKQALERAYIIKSRHLKPSTLNGYDFYKNMFIAYHDDQGLGYTEIQNYSIDQFHNWLDHIRFDYLKDNGQPLSGTSINNAKRSISALFTVLKNERYITHNFIKEIPALDEDPVNNQAFTSEQLTDLKRYLADYDPYLLHFIYFIVYGLLRPREICRLTAGDIHLEGGYLTVETKTEARSVRKLPRQLLSFLKEQKLHTYPKSYQLFTNKEQPNAWSQVSLKGRVDHFGVRFRKVKEYFGYGREYGLYSFRHTAIANLYEGLVKEGLNDREIIHKLMPITQHKSELGLRAYLRKIKKTIPKDYSGLYTLDF